MYSIWIGTRKELSALTVEDVEKHFAEEPQEEPQLPFRVKLPDRMTTATEREKVKYRLNYVKREIGRLCAQQAELEKIIAHPCL